MQVTSRGWRRSACSRGARSTPARSRQTACASPASRTSPRRSTPPPTPPTFPTSTSGSSPPRRPSSRRRPPRSPAAFAARGHDTDLGHLVHELMDEGKAVVAAAGVELHEDPWEMNVHAVRRGETLAAEGHYAHVPSMLEDVRAGRPTEIDFITGALVCEAQKHGTPVPLHAAMYRLVKAREST